MSASSSERLPPRDLERVRKLLKFVDFEMHERLLAVLKSIWSKEFTKAVDIPGYTTIIKQPMDLSIIKRNLLDDLKRPYRASEGETAKRYQVAEEFAHDVRLVSEARQEPRAACPRADQVSTPAPSLHPLSAERGREG